MAEKNEFDDDEYGFSELDNPEPLSDDDLSATQSSSSYAVNPGAAQGNNIRRNSLIVVGLIVLLFLIYELILPVFNTSSKPVDTGLITPPAIKPQPVVQTQPQVATTVQPVAKEPVVDTSLLNKKFASMELGQQNIREDVSSLGNQLSGINSNMAQIAAKIDGLTQSLNELTSKLEQQNTQIALLLAARTVHKKQTPVVKRVVQPSVVYYIQAVIPGRAWLIASNGSTLTVREGTNVPGYGIVKLIDPSQGRVLMSSGRVIKFSQQDS